MVRLIQYIFGSIFLEISGPSVERFLNLCAKQNLVLWKLRPGGKGYQCSVQKRAYETVLTLAEKTGTSVQILEKGTSLFFIGTPETKGIFLWHRHGFRSDVFNVSVYLGDHNLRQ